MKKFKKNNQKKKVKLKILNKNENIMNPIYFKKENNSEYSFIGIINNVFSKEYKKDIFTWLNTMDDFRGGETSFGKIPRKQKWYEMNGRYFSKEWIDQDIERWKSNKYDDELLELQKNIQNIINDFDIYKYKGITKPNINSCLINKYRDGRDSIKPHRDNQTTFGDNPTVIGISFGDEREIVFKRIIYDPNKMNSIKEDKENREELRIPLKEGSMFVMAGAVQKYFSHEIQKVDNKDIRYSLTFREFI